MGLLVGSRFVVGLGVGFGVGLRVGFGVGLGWSVGKPSDVHSQVESIKSYMWNRQLPV